jgi:hypothetical protein
MRACSTAMAALLANPPPNLQSADLFTFTLADGVTTYRWTSYDRDLLVNGAVYSSRSPWLSRSRWSIANTMQVPTLEVFLRALNDGFAGGIDIKGQITNGLFDGASATLDRVWFAAGTNIINDLVYESSGGPLSVVDLNAITNAAPTPTAGLAAGITVSGFDPAETLFLTLPPNLTYTAGYQIEFALKWGTRFAVIPDADTSRAVGFPSLGYDTAEEARAAFPGATVTGGSSYTFYIIDSYTADNSGGISIQIAGSSSHPGIRLFDGLVGDIDIVGNQATINIKGKSNLLEPVRAAQPLPARLRARLLRCRLHAEPGQLHHQLYGRLLADADVHSLERGAARQRRITASARSPSPPGPAPARSARCGRRTRHGLTLIHPLIGTPVAGDAFTAFEGCTKALNDSSGQDCTARSNTQNWRAFPFVPPADTAF